INAIVGVREYCETDVTVKGSALDVAPNSLVTDTLYVPTVRVCWPNPVSVEGTTNESDVPSEDVSPVTSPGPKRTELFLWLNPEPIIVDRKSTRLNSSHS